MKYTVIPNTDLVVSTIGLGTWVFGGEYWGGAAESDSLAAVSAAIDAGITLIDTAPVYGNGLSEEIVGKAIKNKRTSLILATKCGLIQRGGKTVHDLSERSIKKEIGDSLKRLQTDYIDLYQCHWPDPNTSIRETMRALMALKRSGKIRHIGVSNFDARLIKQASAYGDIASLQSPYSLLDRSLDKEILPLCRKDQIGVIVYGALSGGVLTGKYAAAQVLKGPDARNFFYKYYSGAAFDRAQNLLQSLKKLHRPLNQIALNWARQQEGVTTVLAGCRNAQQAFTNATSADWDLTQEEIRSLRAASDAATP